MLKAIAIDSLYLMLCMCYMFRAIGMFLYFSPPEDVSRVHRVMTKVTLCSYFWLFIIKTLNCFYRLSVRQSFSHLVQCGAGCLPVKHLYFVVSVHPRKGIKND